MLKLLGHYKNGNYYVDLYSDGTKVRYSRENELNAEFPENIDLKITNYCDAGCAYCHENSTKAGLHGHFNHDFFNTLRKGTELAIGGGNALEHPELISFLTNMKNKGIICNLTVNQLHFKKSFNFIKELIDNDLIKGIGISYMKYDEDMLHQIELLDNAVVHVINGVISLDDLLKISKFNVKILVLGYKYLRRGEEFYSSTVEKKKQKLKENIRSIISKFKTISFDNLAIEQLQLKDLLTREEWEKFYMGDDGTHTMYIDLVEEEFALSSTSLNRYKILNSIDEMFNIVKESAKINS